MDLKQQQQFIKREKIKIKKKSLKPNQKKT